MRKLKRLPLSRCIFRNSRLRDWTLGSPISVHEWSATSPKYKMAAKIRGVLVDLSGTIHVENTVIPGSIEALKRYIESIRLFCHFEVLILKSNTRLQWWYSLNFARFCVFRRLRETGVSVRFVTNTTKESKETLLRRLTGIGFDIKADEVFTSLTAARRLVDQRKLRPMLLLQQDALEDFKGVDVNDPNAVVVGLAPDCFNYELLNKAFRYRTFLWLSTVWRPPSTVLCTYQCQARFFFFFFLGGGGVGHRMGMLTFS